MHTELISKRILIDNIIDIILKGSFYPTLIYATFDHSSRRRRLHGLSGGGRRSRWSQSLSGGRINSYSGTLFCVRRERQRDRSLGQNTHYNTIMEAADGSVLLTLSHTVAAVEYVLKCFT